MTVHADGHQSTRNEFWWGIAAGILSLGAVFVVPAFVGAEGEGAATTTATTTSTQVATTTEPASESGTSTESITLTVRTESGIVAQEVLVLSGDEATSTLITPTVGGESVPVDAHSALALLVALDASSLAFSITDLAYYASYGSFFLNCIDVSEHLCGYWQYTVNGEYPSIGADKYVLHAGDTVYFFFGSPRLVTLSATSTPVNVPITATLTQYDPEVGEYVPTSGFTLGVVQPDPTNPFAPIEVMTASTNVAGQAPFTVATSGEYQVGIKEDFYYPTVPLVVYTSSSATTTASTTTTNTTTSSGGGGLLSPSLGADGFNVSTALHFLAVHQKPDGSFGAPMFTDWSAIALSSGTTEKTARDLARSYLLGDTSGLSTATDYERRAITLMTLGVNPYSGFQFDLIAKIAGFFDGTQMGDSSLVNDDLFALIPLTRAGFDEDDAMIQKIVTFILSKQKTNGSWEGSVDLTAAAIQALVPLRSVSGVTEALVKAEGYLKGAQKTDGGFGDSFATSWVLQAITALGESSTDWKKNGVDPLDYVTTRQQSDGGMEPISTDENTRIWATAYAIPGVLGKTWSELMTSFNKPASGTTPSDTDGSSPKRATSTATSTVSTTAQTASTTASSSTDLLALRVGQGTTSATTTASTTKLALAATTSTTTKAAPVRSVTKTPLQSADTVATTSIASATSSQVATVLETGKGIQTYSRVLAGIFTLLLMGFAWALMMRRAGV
jgi:hypothetical protein